MRPSANFTQRRFPRLREAKLVKLADKISNIRAIADSPAPDWTAQRKLEYVQWARDVVAGLPLRRPWSRSLTKSRRGRKVLFNNAMLLGT